MLKIFWKWAGSDYTILKDCDQSTQNRFTLNGLIVFLVCVLCFLSAFHAFNMLMHNAWMATPISIFFAWMIFNVYRLLLVTLAKSQLPIKSDKKGALFSLLVRVGFIAFLAIIISKPLETIILHKKTTEFIALHKHQLKNDFKQNIDSFYLKQQGALEKEIQEEQAINTLLGFGGITPNILKLQSQIIEIKHNKKQSISKFESLINRSNFFIDQIRYLNTNHSIVWLITLLVVVLFLLPPWLKYQVSDSSSYYLVKGKVERGIIESAYSNFKNTYSKLFQYSIGHKVSFAEKHIDPPFNTTRIPDTREIILDQKMIEWIQAQNKA